MLEYATKMVHLLKWILIDLPHPIGLAPAANTIF